MEAGEPRKRIVIVARDRYPCSRVDVVDLFSRFVTDRYDLAWVMKRASAGPGSQCIQERETFLVAGRSSRGGASAKLIDAWAWLKLNVRVAAGIIRGRYDIVQCRDTFLMALLHLAAARLARKPFVYWMSFPMAISYQWWARHHAARRRVARAIPWYLAGTVGHYVLRRLVLPLANHVFVQSDEMARQVAGWGIRPDKLTAIPMGINIEAYDPDRIPAREDDFYRGRRALTYVGTLDATRRMEVPVRGVAEVMRRHSDVVFVVIGDSSAEEREPLVDILRQSGVEDRVFFLGFMPLREALSHVMNAAVCIASCQAIPILAVGTPTKLPEYLFMGRRVVANRHPDQSAVIDGAGVGELCEFEPRSFAEAIEQALAKGELSDDERKKTRQWVESHRSYAKLSAKVLGVYGRL